MAGAGFFSSSTVADTSGQGILDMDQPPVRFQSVAPDITLSENVWTHRMFSEGTLNRHHRGSSRQQLTSTTMACIEGRDEGGGLVDMVPIGVMDAIYAALSKEAFVKKLMVPLTENLELKHVVSRWEWQKNTALLELEQRNQQLQHRLREAAEQVTEARSVAQYNRKHLEEAQQKRKQDVNWIGRAEAIRSRLIEQKNITTRMRTFFMFFFSWQRVVHDCRKKKILRKLQLLWDRLMLRKQFGGFVHGYLSLKHRRKIKDKGRGHLVEKSVGQHFRLWLIYIRVMKETKKKVNGFVQTWTIGRLKVAYKGWRESHLTKLWKQTQQNRAGQVWSFSQLRKAWHGWNQHIVLAKYRNYSVEALSFQRLAGGCFSGWLRHIQAKLQRCKQSSQYIKMMESRTNQIAFDVWNHKVSLLLALRKRLMHFVKRRALKLQQMILTKWLQLVWRTRYLRSVEKVLRHKSMVCSKTWAFLKFKRHWKAMKMVQRRQILRLVRTRLASFGTWKARIQRLKAVRRRVVQIQQRLRHRWQQELFSCWVIFAAKSRKFAIAKEANKLNGRVKVLESDLDAAQQVRYQLDKSIEEFTNEHTKDIRSMVGTPVYKSGFLDVELRWRSPSLQRLPPSCAGHTAIALPGKHRTSCSRVVLFGGYNGEECFNHVFIFDTGSDLKCYAKHLRVGCLMDLSDDLHWNAPVISATRGSVIPQAMLTHTACAFGRNKMVLFGGYDGAQEFSDVSLLTISEDGLACEWSQPQLMGGAKPGPVCQHTSCLYENGPYMVVYGGYRSEVGLLNDLWVLDLQHLHWTCPEYFGTPPEPRRGHGAAMVGTKMYMFGGYNEKGHLADLHALDIETMTWECIHGQSKGPSARRQHSLTVVGQHLVVHGGFDGKRYLGDLFSFDTIQRIWKQWPDQETELRREEAGQGRQVCGRSMHTMVEAGQRLVIFGGVHEWGSLQEMVFLENAAAVDGLQLQTILLEEVEKAKCLRAQVTEYERVTAEVSRDLARTREIQEQLRSMLQEESEKKKKAVQGYRVLTRKLQKARAMLDLLSQTCKKE